MSDDGDSRLERIALLEDLQRHPGWRLLMASIEDLRHEILEGMMANPLRSAEAAFAQEYLKGNYFGLSTALMFPQQAIEQLRLEMEMQGGREDGTADRDEFRTDLA